jgi:hypothetical protein
MESGGAESNPCASSRGPTPNRDKNDRMTGMAGNRRSPSACLAQERCTQMLLL